MLGLLRDPAAYRMVDRVHQHRSKRVGDLPKDDPREFISGHRQRLQNLGKTVGSAEDKKCWTPDAKMLRRIEITISSANRWRVSR